MPVSTVPTSTRNMTGFRIMFLGSSMTNDWRVAILTRAGSNSLSVLACRRWILKVWASAAVRLGASISVSTIMEFVPVIACGIDDVPHVAGQAVLGLDSNDGQVVGDRPQHDGRHERERTDQEHRAQKHAGEGQVVGPQRPRGLRAYASSERGTRRPPAAGSRPGTGPEARRYPSQCSRLGCCRPGPRTPNRCWRPPS